MVRINEWYTHRWINSFEILACVNAGLKVYQNQRFKNVPIGTKGLTILPAFLWESG